MEVGRVIRRPPGDVFCRFFLMGCRKESWLTVVVSVHEGVAKQSWHVVLYLPKLPSQAQGRYSKRKDRRVFLLVSNARVCSGIGNHTDHSFMCSCPGKQYSMSNKRNPLFFPLSMIVFNFINKQFLSNEIRILYSSCLDPGWSHSNTSNCEIMVSHTYGRGWQKLSHPSLGGSEIPSAECIPGFFLQVFSAAHANGLVFTHTHTHTLYITASVRTSNLAAVIFLRPAWLILNLNELTSWDGFRQSSSSANGTSNSSFSQQLFTFTPSNSGASFARGRFHMCFSPQNCSPTPVPVSRSPSPTYSIIPTSWQRTRVHRNVLFLVFFV